MRSLAKEKPAQEIKELLVSINRVSKTVKGGKNMSFSALVVVGDGNGKIGYAKGNANEVSAAKSKAFDKAKKSMVKISIKDGRTIHHASKSSFCAARVYIKPAPMGTGVIAGGAMRFIFECAGISDVVAKSFGTSNSYNLVAATFSALKSVESPKDVAHRRDKDIAHISRKKLGK